MVSEGRKQVRTHIASSLYLNYVHFMEGTRKKLSVNDGAYRILLTFAAAAFSLVVWLAVCCQPPCSPHAKALADEMALFHVSADIHNKGSSGGEGERRCKCYSREYFGTTSASKVWRRVPTFQTRCWSSPVTKRYPMTTCIRCEVELRASPISALDESEWSASFTLRPLYS
jgi:hypothetical protein